MQTLPIKTLTLDKKNMKNPATKINAPHKKMSAPETKDASGGRETRSFSLQIKSTGEDGTIEGYGSVFGVRDNYDDVILKGAFTQSLKEHKSEGTMPAMLWQHDADEPIGVWTEMSEDENGLRIKGKLELGTTKGKEAHALLKIGALNGLSIGFVSKSWDYAEVDGVDVRRLKEIDLWEVSVVTFPANQKARVTNVKSSDDMATPKDAEKILREAGFSKSDSTAFVSRVMRMGEVRRDSVDSTAVAMKAANRLLNSLTS